MTTEEFKTKYESLCIGPLTEEIFEKILQGDLHDIELAFNKATDEYVDKDGLNSNYFKGIIKQGRDQQLRIFKSDALIIACSHKNTNNN
jgi:hypothetical protein